MFPNSRGCKAAANLRLSMKYICIICTPQFADGEAATILLQVGLKSDVSPDRFELNQRPGPAATRALWLTSITEWPGYSMALAQQCLSSDTRCPFKLVTEIRVAAAAASLSPAASHGSGRRTRIVKASSSEGPSPPTRSHLRLSRITVPVKGQVSDPASGQPCRSGCLPLQKGRLEFLSEASWPQLGKLETCGAATAPNVQNELLPPFFVHVEHCYRVGSQHVTPLIEPCPLVMPGKCCAPTACSFRSFVSSDLEKW